MATKEPKGTDAVPDAQAVEAAVSAGRAMLAQGSTKIAAAMLIYGQLEELDQVTVTAALKEGAALTEKGAVTYWYTCRRRAVRERLMKASKA